jgi:hypothetical protein
VTEGRDVASFDFGFGPGWFEVPLEAESGETWAAELTGQLLPGASEDEPVAQSLRLQLAQVQHNASAMLVPDLTCAVWVPQPASGYARAVAGFALTDLDEDDSPDAVFAAAEAQPAVDDDGTSYLEVEPWRGRIDGVGPYVGVRELLSHPDEETPGETTLEERVVCTVFPDGSAQAVQLFLSAESIGSFWNITAQATELVETLRVTLAGGPA